MDDTNQNQDGSTSGDGKGTSQNEQKFTQKDMDQFASDKLSAAGRTSQQIEQGKTDLATDRGNFATERESWYKEQEDREEAMARDNPEALKQLREMNRTKAISRENEETAKKNKEEFERNAAVTKENAERDRQNSAQTIATEFKIPVDNILKFGGSTVDSMRDYAKAHPSTSDGTGGQQKTTGPDSGRNTGGGSKTSKQLRDTYTANPTPENRAAAKEAFAEIGVF